jgi:hypothetical protein
LSVPIPLGFGVVTFSIIARTTLGSSVSLEAWLTLADTIFISKCIGSLALSLDADVAVVIFQVTLFTLAMTVGRRSDGVGILTMKCQAVRNGGEHLESRSANTFTICILDLILILASSIDTLSLNHLVSRGALAFSTTIHNSLWIIASRLDA